MNKIALSLLITVLANPLMATDAVDALDIQSAATDHEVLEGDNDDVGLTADVLELENFNLDDATDFLNASQLSQYEKQLLIISLEHATEDPDDTEMLVDMLARAKDALGIE